MLKHVTTTSASHSVMRSLFVTLVVSLLAACGGGSSGDNDQPTGDEGQQIGEAGPIPSTDGPGTEGPSTEGPGVDSTPQMLSVGESISGFLQEEEIIVYRVPADTEIILTTQSGDADIALHEAQELTEETLLCLAN
ncbi:MAG: hypothetical protein KTR32_01215, partial [Granulosicoccus sp.]|nr:hypothetical protein [Granulosicoccus sp.]